MRPLKDVASEQWERFKRWRDTPGAKRAFVVAQAILLALIILWLVWRLSDIGWGAVVANLPASPWFYALLLLKFLTLPVAETFVYQIIWERSLLSHFPAFVRKRIYNNAVAGYSGEAFLTLWARRRLGLSDRDAVFGVKDSNFLSAFSANATTILLILWLFSSENLRARLDSLPGGGSLFAIAFALATGFAATVILFRKRLIHVSAAKTRAILGVHALRQAAQLAIFSALYAAAIPAVPYATWFVFVALQYVITRIPFLPNQELVYLGAALTLSASVGAPQEAVAGMLIAETGLLQALYFALFIATAHLAQTKRDGAPGGVEAEAMDQRP